jgi:hypothetical protein
MSAISATAQTVATLEADLESVERQAQELETSLVLMTHERDTLREKLAVVSAERDEYMITAAQMRSIMESTSMGLVQGLKRMADAQQRRSTMTADRKSHALGVDPSSAPLFIRKRRPSANPEEQERLARLADAISGGDESHDAAIERAMQAVAPEAPAAPVQAPLPPMPPMRSPAMMDARVNQLFPAPYREDARLPKVEPVTPSDFEELRRANDGERPTYTPAPQPRTREQSDADSLSELSGALSDPEQRPYIRDRQ